MSSEMLGRIRRVTVTVESENPDGSIDTYEVSGTLGTIYRRASRMHITPHYGDPGMPPTQVEVQIDAMLVPVKGEESHPLQRILTEEPGAPRLAQAETITLKELGR